jgi:hypothetical protein
MAFAAAGAVSAQLESACAPSLGGVPGQEEAAAAAAALQGQIEFCPVRGFESEGCG